MNKRRRARIVVVGMTVVIVIAGVYGFGSKLEEFVRALLDDNRAPGGEFVFIPVLNYFLASSGFVFLFIWAALNGMFRDIERPKYDMLERERQLDAEAGQPWESQT